ncbi:ribosome recycling factor [Candidatus Roizmanbacteria bacterium]|nr:ribosome recycling factor [Candidatus Roizmanbacteria bacterium]
MDPIIVDFKNHADKTVSYLKEELKTIRTGKANPSMLENLSVDAYGGQTKLRLMELATITSEGPTTLVVIPFDPATTQDIERGILKSPLGISPSVQGGRIMIKLPLLSEEQRQKMTKLVGQQTEEKKQTVRNLRDEARKKVKIQLEKKEITEDDKFRTEKDIDTVSQKYLEEIDRIRTTKEQEIMAI